MFFVKISLLIFLFFQINAKDERLITIFHDPPKPLAVWQDPFPMPETFQRPIEWNKKHFGQWCRNFTIDM